MERTKLNKKAWLTIIVFGLIGQIAWSIENMQFNLFLFNYIGGTTSDIAKMVAYSALVSTCATLVIGIISDKIGHRKKFLCYGYVIWGIMTMGFALISRENVAKVFPTLTAAEILARTAFLVILMDCVMSFFGSLANDASFNAWVTEKTDESNRGSVEGVLNIFPLLSMLIVAGASGIIIEKTGWPLFFVIMGLSVSVCGLLGLFFVEDTVIKNDGDNMNLFESIIYGFKPSVIKKNKLFYVTLLAMCIFNISVQIFMPYLLIYLEKTLGFDTVTYSIVMAVVIILASIVSVIIGKVTDKMGRSFMSKFSIILFVVGLLLVSFMKTPIPFIICATIMMSGYVSVSVVFMSAIRDYTPIEHVGMFQGIRLLAYVLIPMVVGPFIGDYLIHNYTQGTYVNTYNEVVELPVPALFVASAIVALIILIPALKLFTNKKTEIIEE